MLLSAGLLIGLCMVQMGCLTLGLYAPGSTTKYTRLGLEAEAAQIFKVRTETDEYPQTFVIPFRLKNPQELHTSEWHLFDRESGYLTIQAGPIATDRFSQYLEYLLNESRDPDSPIEVLVEYRCGKEGWPVDASLNIRRKNMESLERVYPKGTGAALRGSCRLLPDSNPPRMDPLLPEPHAPIHVRINESASYTSYVDLIWKIPLTPVAVAIDAASTPIAAVVLVAAFMFPEHFGPWP